MPLIEKTTFYLKRQKYSKIINFIKLNIFVVSKTSIKKIVVGLRNIYLAVYKDDLEDFFFLQQYKHRLSNKTEKTPEY